MKKATLLIFVLFSFSLHSFEEQIPFGTIFDLIKLCLSKYSNGEYLNGDALSYSKKKHVMNAEEAKNNLKLLHETSDFNTFNKKSDRISFATFKALMDENRNTPWSFFQNESDFEAIKNNLNKIVPDITKQLRSSHTPGKSSGEDMRIYELSVDGKFRNAFFGNENYPFKFGQIKKNPNQPPKFIYEADKDISKIKIEFTTDQNDEIKVISIFPSE